MKFDIELPWSEFKSQVLDTVGWQWIYFDIDNTYKIFAKQNDFTVLCKIFKDSGADQTDFEGNYQSLVSSRFENNVRTKFEVDEIVLKLAKISGQADSNGDLSLEIQVPGSIANVERYVSGGYAYVDNYAWTDAVTKIEVKDNDNVLGYGAGAVLKTYHDADVPTDNQGWFFEKHHGNEGVVEIEPMGWYGQFNGELYLKLTFKVSANAKVKAILWWGKTE
jgi:hypothetical protein